MGAIYTKELKGYFTSLTGYVYLAFFTLAVGIYYVNYCVLSASTNFTANVLGHMALIFLIVIPILSMGLMSEDKKQKTDQLLFTAPIHPWEIVLGKYLAALTLFTCSLCLVALFPLVTSFFGPVSPTMTGAGFLGTFLMGAGLIAIGMLISCLTEHQIISAILTFGVLFLMYLLPYVTDIFPERVANVINWFSLMERFDGFINGIIRLSAVVYYLSFVVFSMVFGSLVVGRRGRKKFSTLLCLIILAAVLIGANIGVEKSKVKVDVTQNQIFTISEQSKKIAKNLDKDVTIHFLCRKSDVEHSYLEIVEQLEAASDHIFIDYKDPARYPNFGAEYVAETDAIAAGDVIITCGEKGRYLSQDTFVSYTYDDDGDYEPLLNVEPQIVSGINSVISEKTPIIYALTGHGELEFDTEFRASVEQDNFTFKELNLLIDGAIPKDCEILLIDAPISDLSSEDADLITEYVKNGGKLFYVCNTDPTADSMPRFDAILKNYGVNVAEGVVVETDSNMFMQDYPTYLLPKLEESGITTSLLGNNMFVLTPVSKGLILDADKAVSLLSTSANAFAKVNTESETTEFEEGDVTNPGGFSVAARVDNAAGEPQMIVFGCPSAILGQIDTYVSGGNSDFISNCFNTLASQEDKVALKAKALVNNTAAYSNTMVTVISFMAVIGLPGILLMFGIMVTLRRKHSK